MASEVIAFPVLMYGDVTNDMHLKASAMILHQVNGTSD